MKQVAKTDTINALLRASLGDDADLSAINVYEAIALNTQPLRKRHPLYKDAVADVSLLVEMAGSVNRESIPLHLQHESHEIPHGRVFHGSVVGEELRVLFFVDGTHPEIVQKIEAGTLDQVSVSVLSKQLLNSKSGFDYFGPDSDSEYIWSGTDPDGNTLGEKGVYGIMKGLEGFYELSLVGRGGAQGARIVSPAKSAFGAQHQRLAASGVDPSGLILKATAEQKEPDMDLTALVTQLTDTKANLLTLTGERDTLRTAAEAHTATLTERDATIATLTAERDALQVELDGLKAQDGVKATADLSEATTVLQDLAKRANLAAGKVGVTLPGTVAELKAMIEETTLSMAGILSLSGKSAEAASTAQPDHTPGMSAFRTRPRQ